MKTLLLLPNQLFKTHNFDFDKIILYEHPKFFTKFNYHKAKLVLHRSSMKSYSDYISKKYKVKVEYINFDEYKNMKQLFNNLKDDIIVYDPVDFEILKEINNMSKISNTGKIDIVDSKLFILNQSEIDEYINFTKKPYFNATFYKWIRLKKQILVKNDKPIMGKWSFDVKNRLPFLKTYKENKIKFYNNTYVEEAKKYVQKHFKNNIGEMNLFVPISHSEAEKYYKLFLKERFKNFGPYEDAFSSDVVLGYHSGISALLNIGLLDPKDIIDSAIELQGKIKIESLEGFIRQIISWREYVRMLYVKEHKKFIKMNFLNHRNKLSKSWYDGTTQILPIDNIIKKALNISYAHHIERLMCIGNFMMLMQINPKYVYKWFIEVISIDAYEWVMEPNVYGMSQHSVSQLMMNRPYFSSSNYILKMSNYKNCKTEDIKIYNKYYSWCDIWDALYYNFVNNNKNYLSKIYATANSVYILNKKSNTDKENLFKLAKAYIKLY